LHLSPTTAPPVTMGLVTWPMGLSSDRFAIQIFFKLISGIAKPSYI
jgi:hypothetical protein